MSALQQRLPKRTVFTGSLFMAGVSLFCAASVVEPRRWRSLFVGLMGVSVGPVYVMGFVLLQQEVDDELRGRVFSSLNTLVRLCVLVSMVAGPLLAALLGKISERARSRGSCGLAGGTIAIPGVRLTLWLAALIIIGAGFARLASLRSGQRLEARPSPHPSRHTRIMTRGRARGRGRFIAFEGGEACGKSTQAALLADALGAVLTREPGGTAIGARLRALLLDPATEGLDHRAEALLMAADRAQHVAEVVAPALELGPPRGHRSLRRLSSIAYQGYGRGLPVDEVRGISEWATAGCGPTSSCCSTCRPRSPSRPARRGARPHGAPSRRRSTPRSLEGFRAQAAADPERWVVVDGSRHDRRGRRGRARGRARSGYNSRCDRLRRLDLLPAEAAGVDLWGDVVGQPDAVAELRAAARGPGPRLPARRARGAAGSGPWPRVRRRAARRAAVDGDDARPPSPSWPSPRRTPTSWSSSGRARRITLEQADEIIRPRQPVVGRGRTARCSCSTSSTWSARSAGQAAEVIEEPPAGHGLRGARRGRHRPTW